MGVILETKFGDDPLKAIILHYNKKTLQPLSVLSVHLWIGCKVDTRGGSLLVSTTSP